MVTSGGRGHECLDGVVLPEHVTEFERGRHRAYGRDRFVQDGIGRLELGTVPDRRGSERVHGDDLDTGDERRFRGVGGRHHDDGSTGLPCRADDGEDPGRRTEPAVESQLARVDDAGDGLGRDGPRGGQARQRDAQIERRSVLREPRRREVDRDAMRRDRAVGVHDGLPHAPFGLRDRSIGQADDGEAGQTGRHVRLDLDDGAVEAQQADGPGSTDRHHITPVRCSTTAGASVGATTPTTSMRRTVDRPGCEALHSAASARSRRSLRNVTASNG